MNGALMSVAATVSAFARRFVLSINAADGAREVFARFQIEEVETNYTITTAVSGGGKREGADILDEFCFLFCDRSKKLPADQRACGMLLHI